MTPDDPISAALDPIRDRIRKAEDAGMSRDLDGVIYTHGLMTGTSRRLLAALDAVLKLADEARPELSFPPSDCTNACAEGPCNCSGTLRDAGWSLDPAAVHEAITRALTGEAGDA